MNLMYKILPICLLLEVCSSSLRNFRISHSGGGGGGYPHHSGMALQHDNNYQHYDSYSSEEVVIRASPRRKKYHRHFDYSDSEYNYKCQCSCTKCQKRKPKPKPCCEEYCATECAPQNNILVVPYPVPFMVFNQSAPDFPNKPIPPIPTPPQLTPSSPPPTITTTYEPTTTTTTQTTPPTRRTFPVTYSTVPYYDAKPYKRFRIIDENNPRRNNMAKNVLRSPNFGRLPKYGIVPIPENLALSLMQQIRKDQNNDQLRKRLALDKNLLDYTRKPIA